MSQSHAWLKHVRFFSSATLIYALTIAFAAFLLQPVRHPSRPAVLASSVQKSQAAQISRTAEIAGRPVRIVLPDSGIDLPVDPGYYDSTTQSWTLSGYRAQFATISSPANNLTGDTFIYGHNNNYVFGALRHRTPSVGEPALLYTDNGHVFSYHFVSTVSVSPDDTTVLSYDGPPVMTIQTCTGSLNEWRTMYRFAFDRVAQ